MKAWLVREKGEYTCGVVFAETRGKARVLAMLTSACEDCSFCDIEVNRLPEIDKHHKDGKTEMDWNNPKDRITLVKECGFQCENIEYAECEDCAAREFCDLYQDYQEELELNAKGCDNE